MKFHGRNKDLTIAEADIELSENIERKLTRNSLSEFQG
jgi:hypothetical protein